MLERRESREAVADLASHDEREIMRDSNEALGAVLGGMIAFDHALQNNLTDSHLDEAIDWAKRFRDLYDDVRKHNRDIYIQEVLWEFEGWRESVPRKVEHYEGMKMGGRS